MNRDHQYSDIDGRTSEIHKRYSLGDWT